MMSWTTVRCWLMRLGLYALLLPLKQAYDWAYLIDHTVQIGYSEVLRGSRPAIEPVALSQIVAYSATICI